MVQHADLDHSVVTGAGIQPTTVDAKGDLLAGTAADTVGRLAVGANDTILMADSGETTGLKWVAAGTPTDQDYDDVAAAGTADTFARGDHLHGMPSASGGGGGGGLLAVHTFTATGDLQTAGTSMADVDASNVFVTFTAPASGEVLIRASATAEVVSGVKLLWGLREGASNIAGSEEIVLYNSGGTIDGRPNYEKVVTGLTPTTSYTYKLAHRVHTGSSGFVLNTSVCVMSAWEIP